MCSACAYLCARVHVCMCCVYTCVCSACACVCACVFHVCVCECIYMCVRGIGSRCVMVCVREKDPCFSFPPPESQGSHQPRVGKPHHMNTESLPPAGSKIQKKGVGGRGRDPRFCLLGGGSERGVCPLRRSPAETALLALIVAMFC